MPTGVEEAIAAAGAALASFVAAGVAASPFSGPPNPAGAATAAGSSAAVADEPIIPPEVLEGTAEMPAPAVPVSTDAPGGEGGPGPTPVTGDRPPPSASYGRPLTEVRGGVRERRVEFAEAEIVARRPASAMPEPQEEGPGVLSTAQPTQTPAAGTPPAWQPSFDPPPTWHPPLVPAAGEPGQAGGGLEPAAAPLLKPAADIAADMERLSVDYPSPLVITPMGAPLATNWLLRHLLDMSTEEIAEAARDAVSDLLTDRIRATPVVSSSLPTSTAGGAAVAATIADVGIALVTQALEPESVVRGVMRIGSVTPQGLRQIEEGNTAVGASAIAGDVANAVLVVLPTLRAVGSRGATLGPEGSGSTIYVNRARFQAPVEGGGTRSRSPNLGDVTAHNIVEVVEKGTAKITHVIGRSPEKVGATGLPAGTALVSEVREIATNAASRMSMAKDMVGYTRASSAAAAQKGTTAMIKTLYEMKHGAIGVLGPYSTFGENCSMYAASIVKAMDVTLSGRLGPQMTYLQFKYLGTVEGAHVVGGIVVPGAVQQATAAGSAPPPGTR